MEPILVISGPIKNNTEILDFSTQIQTSENNNIKLFYILYHIAIGVLKIAEGELVLNLPKYTLQLKNWKPLLWKSVQKNDESLLMTYKEVIKKIIAISSRIKAWETIIENTNKKIDSGLAQVGTYLIKLVEIQEEYKSLKLEIARVINEEIPPIKKALNDRINCDNRYNPTDEDKKLILRCYDISLKKFEEHFLYFRSNTYLLEGHVKLIEIEVAGIDPTQKFFISFKNNFKTLYKRITEPKSEPGLIEYYFGSVPEDLSDPLNDYDIKTLHSIEWKPIPIQEKNVLGQAENEQPRLNIEVEGSAIYQFITSAISNNANQDYPLEIRDFMSAVINVGGREAYKLFHTTSDHLEAYQQIQLWEQIPDILKKEEVLALIHKAQELLKKIKTIEEDTRGEQDFIFKMMSSKDCLNCRDTEEAKGQEPLVANLQRQEISQDLIDSSMPVYRLSVLRISQENFSKLSEEHYKPLLNEIQSIQQQLLDHIAFANKDIVSDEIVELIGNLFDITEKWNIWDQMDNRKEGNDKDKIKKLDIDIKTKFEEMKKTVKSYKKCFNESLCAILGVDSWWEKKSMSPIDTPNILKLEKVRVFIETEKNRIEAQKKKDVSEEKKEESDKEDI